MAKGSLSHFNRFLARTPYRVFREAHQFYYHLARLYYAFEKTGVLIIGSDAAVDE